MHENGIHNWISRSPHGEDEKKEQAQNIQEYKKNIHNEWKILYVSNTDDRSPLSAEWKSVSTMFIGAAQSFISPDPMESVSSSHFI